MAIKIDFQPQKTVAKRVFTGLQFVLFFFMMFNLNIHINAQVLPHQDLVFRYYLKEESALSNATLAPISLSKNKLFKNNYIPVTTSAAKLKTNDLTQKERQDSTLLVKNTYLPVFHEYSGFDSIHDITQHVLTHPFYVYKSEISNKEYRAFLEAMRIDSTFIKDYGLKLSEIVPDTQVWIQGIVHYNEPYVHYYFQHEAYNDYPVVGVSAVQARAYCKWLQMKLKIDWFELLPKGYKVEVDLPTTAEWIAAYDEFIAQPLYPILLRKYAKGSKSAPWNSYINNKIKDINHYNLLNIIGMKDGILLNVNGLSTLHGIKVYQLGDINSWRLDFMTPMSVNNMPFPKEMPAANHFLGNVSEWTSTPAAGHLFNNKTYTYNISGTLVPNAYQSPTAFDLSKTLWKEEDLENYYAIKGGSYAKDFYYTEPFAVEFKHKYQSSAYVGFRPVIRIYYSSPSF